MVFLKEDGSLDIERINKLPIEDFINKISSQKINEQTSKQQQIYQRYIQKKGICQEYKDIIDYFIYLHEDELINELPKESINILEKTIFLLEKMLKNNEDLTIDKKIIEMTINEGKKLLKQITVLYINEDGSIDLTNFNLLNESEQVSVMSTWNQEQIMSYYMQNSISEEECFAPVLELIDDLEKLERSGHNF